MIDLQFIRIFSIFSKYQVQAREMVWELFFVIQPSQLDSDLYEKSHKEVCMIIVVALQLLLICTTEVTPVFAYCVGFNYILKISPHILEIGLELLSWKSYWNLGFFRQ